MFAYLLIAGTAQRSRVGLCSVTASQFKSSEYHLQILIDLAELLFAILRAKCSPADSRPLMPTCSAINRDATPGQMKAGRFEADYPTNGRAIPIAHRP